jgi:hypothetical protein
MITPNDPPHKAENDAWWSYKMVCKKQGREPDERTFRDAWRQGCRFTFGATSVLSPAIAAFIDWMQYVTDWAPPPDQPAKEDRESLRAAYDEGWRNRDAERKEDRETRETVDYVDPGPAASYMTTAQMDGFEPFEPEAKKPTQARS